MSKILGIDGNEANVQNRVGSGQFAAEIIKQFAKLKTNHNFLVYLKDKPLPDLPKETANFAYRVFGPSKFWTQFALPLNLYLKNPRPNVFFTPSHYGPRFSPIPVIITIFDLSFIHYPKMFKRSDLYQLKNWTEYSVKKAAKIITISESSKADIVKFYNIPNEKIVVAHPGVNENFRPQSKDKIEAVKKKYKISGDYLLYVGTLQPRKNLVRLIEAFSKINSNILLVIAGKPGWLYDEIFAKVKKLRLENKVVFTDFVPNEDLPALFSGAKLYVNVSLWEGFGIPVAEAMACGTPVIVSNTSSLPEVVGGSGILVNPESVREITGGILKVLNLSNKDYQNFRKNSQKQASKFKWDKCVWKTLAILTEIK